MLKLKCRSWNAEGEEESISTASSIRLIRCACRDRCATTIVSILRSAARRAECPRNFRRSCARRRLISLRHVSCLLDETVRTSATCPFRGPSGSFGFIALLVPEADHAETHSAIRWFHDICSLVCRVLYTCPGREQHGKAALPLARRFQGSANAHRPGGSISESAAPGLMDQR